MTKTIVDSGSARPFWKCAGGKTKLLPDLMERVPKSFGTYHEPFVGGGALFWALAPGLRWATLADTNAHLTACYEAVHLDVEPLIARLRRMKNTEDDYYRVRDREANGPLAKAARALYLNKTCFNGLWRENRSGKMNVPFGHYANPTFCDADNLRACSAALARLDLLSIHSSSFESVVGRAEKGDFAFFDPPYLPISKTSNFTNYGSAGFGYADHVRLRDVALELKSKKVHVMITNCDHPEIRKLYAKGFKIAEVSAPRSINSVASKRGPVPELIIT